MSLKILGNLSDSLQTTSYLYDPLNSSANSGPIIELDSAGISGPSAFNLRAPDGRLLTRAQQATGALSALADDAPIAYHSDNMGSALAYIDTSDGSLEGGNVYSAFGENLESSGYGANQSYEYLDRVQLGTTGLVNMNARTYDPGLGRFLSQDPISGAPVQSQSLNPYAYGLGNPFSTPDLTGLSALYGSGGYGSYDPTGMHGLQTVSSGDTWVQYIAGSNNACVLSLLGSQGCYYLSMQANKTNMKALALLINTAGGFSIGAQRRASIISSLLRNGKGLTGWSNLNKAGRFAQALKPLAKAAPWAAGILEAYNQYQQNQSTGRAIAGTGGSLAGGAAGAAGGAWVCGQITAISAGWGAASCLATIPIGGALGAWRGEKAAKSLYDVIP